MTSLQTKLNNIQEPGSHALSVLFSSSGTKLFIAPISADKNPELIKTTDLGPAELIGSFTSTGKDFHSVSIISAHKAATLIPDGLYIEASTEDYLDQVFGPSRSDCSVSTQIPSLSLHCVFRMDKALYEQIKRVFPQAHIRHLNECMILEGRAQQKHEASKLLRVHLQDQDLFVLGLEGKSLILQSHHHIQDPTDVVYHVLNTLGGLTIDHETADIAASGELAPESEAYRLLKSYCPKIAYRSAVIKGLSSREEFILANQAYCES